MTFVLGLVADSGLQYPYDPLHSETLHFRILSAPKLLWCVRVKIATYIFTLRNGGRLGSSTLGHEEMSKVCRPCSSTLVLL